MSAPHSPPYAALLEKLLLGQLPPADAEALCDQLQDSEQFAALAQTLVASDTLIEAVRGQASNPTPRPDARLEGLMARLSKLRPDLSGIADDRTAADVPAAAAPIAFLSPPRQPDEMGRLGDYRVLKVLGQGGMGIVFLAEDERLGRRVALKTMRPESAQMANAKQRFLREARGTAAIEHDHIVPIFQVGEENGVPYLAMPFLRGEPLDERLKRAGGEALPLTEIVRIGREIAEGLAAAHEQGLIHRDIKPANVWLEGERGRVKVLDFGLARAAGADAQLTQSGAIVGTPAYMAPEQARGEAVDARSDLFSLGCLLYQMSTGHKPFNGPDTMSILMSLALDQPAPPRQRNAVLPVELSNLITSLLAKKPEDRPASARVVADALATIERGLVDDTAMSPARRLVQAAAPPRKRQHLLVTVAAAILLLGGLTALVVVIIRDKHGKEVGRMAVPKDGSVEVKPDDQAKPPENDKKQVEAIPADPVPKIEPGTPLSSMALVTNPARLPGVRSWTIETRTSRGGIDAVAYRPDGHLIATAGEDGVIRLLVPQSGRLLRILVGHASRISRLAWSPDGRTLASGSWDGTVRLWDTDSGRQLRKLTFGFMVDSLFWFPDGRTLAASRDNITHTWDVVRGELVRNQTWPDGAVPLALSPDGKQFAGRAGTQVRIWEAETGREVRTLPGEIKGASHLCWSPDGRLLASTGGDHTVRLWELETAKELWSRKHPEARYVRTAFSPDGKTLAVDRHPSVIEFLRAEDGKVLTWFQGVGFVNEMAWSSDSGHFAVGTVEGNLWLLKSAKTLPNIIPPTVPGLANGSTLMSLAWSPDGKQLAATTYAPGTRIVNPATGETSASLSDAGRIIAWWPSKWLAAAGPETQLSLWQSGKRRILPAHKSGWVGALAWSPDGKTLGDAGRESGTLRLWDGETRQLQRQWEAGKWINELSWSPDGKLLAAGMGAGPQLQVKLWRTDTGKELRTIAGFNGAAWSPVGQTLALYSGHGANVQLVDGKTGELGLKLPMREIHGLAWSPDGKQLATACPGGADDFWRLQLWDAATGEEVRRMERVCLSTFAALAWSPEGKRIVACASQTVQLWDAASGKSESVILPNPHFHGLMIRPDGRYRGNFKVDEGIAMVVQKEDGSTETLPPTEFARKYKWKNEP
ncbi:MAG TPA: protein kinase [Gemmataceae bacterium]|jgi:WD40 repeat protein